MCTCRGNIIMFKTCCGCGQTSPENPDNPDTGIPDTILVPILQEGQDMFSNVVPENRTVNAVFIEGIYQRNTTDYNVVGNTIDWVSTELTLIPDFKFIIVLN